MKYINTLSLSENLKSQLRAMGLDELINIIEDSAVSEGWDSLSFDDKLGLVVNRLYESKLNSSIRRLKKGAKLIIPNASISGVLYDKERKLDQSHIVELATCDFIKQDTNIILEGPVGCGKTYLSNALVNAACSKTYRSYYIRFQDLLNEIDEAAEEGTVKKKKFIKKLANYTLLVIDEWLTVEISKQHQTQLLELFEMRSYKGSTILCSLHPIKEWRQLLLGDTIAESIMDRITSNKDVITFGAKNMRRWEREQKRS